MLSLKYHSYGNVYWNLFFKIKFCMGHKFWTGHRCHTGQSFIQFCGEQVEVITKILVCINKCLSKCCTVDISKTTTSFN